MRIEKAEVVADWFIYLSYDTGLVVVAWPGERDEQAYMKDLSGQWNWAEDALVFMESRACKR